MPGHEPATTRTNPFDTVLSLSREMVTAVCQVLGAGRRDAPSGGRLDETTLSQCNSQIIMRLVNPTDQNFVRRAIESLGEDEANMLPDLDVGEALLAGQLTSCPVLVPHPARLHPYAWHV